MQQIKQSLLMRDNAFGQARALPIDEDTLNKMKERGEVELIRGSTIAYRMKPITLAIDDIEDFTKPASTYETKVMVAKNGNSARTARR